MDKNFRVSEKRNQLLHKTSEEVLPLCIKLAQRKWCKKVALSSALSNAAFQWDRIPILIIIAPLRFQYFQGVRFWGGGGRMVVEMSVEVKIVKFKARISRKVNKLGNKLHQFWGKGEEGG